MTTYTFPKTQICAGQVVKTAGPPARGLLVCERPGLSTGRDRWEIMHLRSGSWVMINLDRATAVAVAKKMAELADWDLPASAFQARNRKRRGTIRHLRIAQLARANPREFAVNGGGMEKA